MHEKTDFNETSSNIMSLIVRVIGLFLLLAGLWVAILVMLEALELYHKPQHIEQFARAIERGSNVDKSLMSIRKQVSADPDDQTGGTPETTKQIMSANDIRVSYFFAWIIVLLLLLLIGRISISAIKTGGELVLYDVQIKRLARMLISESGKIDR